MPRGFEPGHEALIQDQAALHKALHENLQYYYTSDLPFSSATLSRLRNGGRWPSADVLFKALKVAGLRLVVRKEGTPEKTKAKRTS